MTQKQMCLKRRHKAERRAAVKGTPLYLRGSARRRVRKALRAHALAGNQEQRQAMANMPARQREAAATDLVRVMAAFHRAAR